MHLTTTRKKRLAGVAALAFGGAAILGACHGEGEYPFCPEVTDALAAIEAEIGETNAALETAEGVDARLLELKLSALEVAYEAKLDLAATACPPA